MGADLFKQTSNAVIYARIMARARRMDAVVPGLGVEPATDQQVSNAVGTVIAETYTPEEKARIAPVVGRAGPQLLDRRFAMPACCRWCNPRGWWSWNPAGCANRWEETAQIDGRFVTLQSQRGLYGELARELEAFGAKSAEQSVQASALVQAAQAFNAEGDVDSAVHVMRLALARNALSGDLLDRYLTWAASQRPQELLTVINNNPIGDIRNKAVQLRYYRRPPGPRILGRPDSRQRARVGLDQGLHGAYRPVL